MQHIADEALISQTLAGNQQAYAALVDRYAGYVFTLVLRYIASREEAEELAQDVFVKAYRSLADFKGKSKFSTWLYTIVHTSCLSQLRKVKSPVLLVEEDQLLAAGGHTSSAAGMLESKSQRKMLSQALTLLNSADAELLTLFYLHEQSLDEIAVILGLSSNNIKVRLFRARSRLKEILEKHFPQEIADRK